MKNRGILLLVPKTKKYWKQEKRLCMRLLEVMITS